MALSAFGDRAHAPTDEDLRSVLGRAYGPWTKLLALVAERIDPVAHVWGFTSAKTGWGLRVCQKQRVILYMTPKENEFLVSFALGEKAVASAAAAKMSAGVWSAIESAPRYAEGRGVRIVVTNSGPLVSLARLAEIKSQS